MAHARTLVEMTDNELPSRSESVAWAEGVLRDQGMPRDELVAVLRSGDAETVRRHLELHLERLEEWLIAQRRRAASVQRVLIAGEPLDHLYCDDCEA